MSLYITLLMWNFVLFLQTFVILVTMIREAIDDIRRYKRDKEVNSIKYIRTTRQGLEKIPSSDIHVGDIIIVEKVRIHLL